MKRVKTFYHYFMFLVPFSLSIQIKETVANVLTKDLVTRIPVQKTGKSEKCCNENNLFTCESVTVDSEMLGQDDITILGIRFTFSNRIEPHGFVYKTGAGDEAVITYSEASGNMFGSVKTTSGKSYAIERCHGGHVVKEYDVSSFGGDIGQKYTLELNNIKIGNSTGVESPEGVENVSRKAGYDSNDMTTLVDYSIMLYYTPEVQDNVADLDGFFYQVLAETNQGG